ncbi:aminoadipate-semialdehyde dehydrogenase [Planoprotostelium fungivorum]|uniref:Saccharopine dehydrogenase [NAD(+), L-lysine-forming] n=1 Tax=Planoprotostelium fungivorum TaxID=1890364 RepID=A0A2P6NAJ1_9EUKA|nr:aminoadipate-semialdehyde dehydrogenase [Planoprotostelium fungivorum]
MGEAFTVVQLLANRSSEDNLLAHRHPRVGIRVSSPFRPILDTRSDHFPTNPSSSHTQPLIVSQSTRRATPSDLVDLDFGGNQKFPALCLLKSSTTSSESVAGQRMSYFYLGKFGAKHLAAFSGAKSLHFWIRAETKEGEKRVPIVPSDVSLLISSGHTVTVESCQNRCFPDKQYENAGATLVTSGSWRTAPSEAIIVGLKELPDEKFPLMHTHIYFANAYKKQPGWEELLGRFHRGGGVVLDMEYLTDELGRRVAAFGNPAGYIGLAAGVLTWCHQREAHQAMTNIPAYRDFSSLGSRVESALRTAIADSGKRPRVLVIGPNGRVGSGATRLAHELGLECAGWDITKTARGGPFLEMLDFDIVINAIWLTRDVRPFLTRELLEANPLRRMSVLVDVSCDPHNPFHPFPIYNKATTLSRPVSRAINGDNPLDIIAVDNLCSIIPHQCSTQFSANLVKHLLDREHSANVWNRNIFDGMVKSIRSRLESAPQDLPPVLSLPTDFPRRDERAPALSVKSLPLPPSVTEFIRSFSERWNAGAELVVAAVWDILLHRYTGEEELSIGIGRYEEDNRSTYQKLRLTLSNQTSFTEFFLEVAMAIRRSLKRNGSRGVASYVREEGKHLQSLFLSSSSPLSLSSQLDLSFAAQNHDLSLFLENDSVVHVLYRPDLFADLRATETCEQVSFLLQQIVTDSKMSIGKLSLVTPHASRVLPDPKTSLDLSWLGSIHSIFHKNALSHPHKTAAVHRNEIVTYGELDSMTSKLANHLLSGGLQREDAVFIYGSRNLAMVVAVMGILKAGGAVSLMDPIYPPERITNCLRVAKPKGWISIQGAGEIPREVKEFMPTVGCDLVVDLPLPSQFNENPSLRDASDVDPEIQVDKHDTAVVTFTSGSTGLPKGVLGRHGPLTAFYPWIQKTFNLNGDDRVSMCSGISHDPLQRDIFTPLYLGAEIHVPDADDIGNPGQLAKWMREHEITVTHLTPAMGQLLSDTDGADTMVTTLKLALFVGDKLTKRDVTRLRSVAPQVTAVNMYGSTESQRSVTYYVVPPNEILAGMKEILPVGVGMKDVQFLILNDGSRVGVGEVGEIYMRSAHLARGYKGLDEVNRQKFIVNPFTGIDEDRFYRTGDFGRYYPDGQGDVVGRLDNQVKIRGFRIELGEINTALASHPQVKENVPYVREDTPDDKKIVAYVIPKDIANPPKISELREHVGSKLPHYMVPANFVFMSSIPLTPNGKIAFDQLPPPSTTSQTEKEADDKVVFPEKVLAKRARRTTFSSDDQVTIAAVWQDVLGLTSFGKEDNFFTLGGHSLLATRCVAKLSKSFGTKIPLSLLLENPNVPALSLAIRKYVTGQEVNAENFRPDVSLDAGIVPREEKSTRTDRYFLSGATGFLGVFILRDLLRIENVTVHVLVRATSKIDGRQRIKHAMKLHRVWEDSYEPRIVPVPGDLSQPLLGLTRTDFETLAGEVDMVIHCAAHVHWLLPYSQLKPANVLGTQEVIRLAGTTHTKPIHHVSTTSVFESDYFDTNRGEIREDVDISSHYNGLRGGYAQSKWAAELLMSQARDRGFKVNVYRPAYISGDCGNGVWTTDDFLCRVIRGCIQMGAYPTLDDSGLDISPVDFVSGAIVQLSRSTTLESTTYHLTNSHMTTFRQFFSVAGEYGYDLKELNYNDWRARLLELQEKDDGNALQVVSTIFTENYNTQLKNPTMSRDHTERDLSATGPHNREIRELIPLYLSYLLRSGFLPKPQRETILFQEQVTRLGSLDLVTRTNRSHNQS